MFLLFKAALAEDIEPDGAPVLAFGNFFLSSGLALEAIPPLPRFQCSLLSYRPSPFELAFHLFPFPAEPAGSSLGAIGRNLEKVESLPF